MPNEKKTTRKLRAILSADVQGYSLLMADDETFTIKTLKVYRSIMSTLIKEHNGRVVDAPGDNLLADFSSVVDAVECAVEIQKRLETENFQLEDERRLQYRIGVNIGDVVQDGDRIYGNGVNVAARIEGLADPGGVCISRNAYDHISDKLNYGFEYLGEHSVKNITKPVRVYKLLMAEEDAGKLIGDVPKTATKKWILATTVLAVIVITSVVWQVYQKMTEPEFEPAKVEEMAYPLPEKPSIAVLPFVNMSGNPEQEYIGDSIAENVITALSYVPEMFVIARTSTFAYKGKSAKIKQISEELGVRYVLEGSVQKSKDRIRVTAQLIDAISGHHLWADRYDRNIEDFFKVLDEIAKEVVIELQVKLTEGDISRISHKTDSFEAWLSAITAYSFLQLSTKENITKAKELFEKAVRLDPEYGFAWGGLGGAHNIEGMTGWGESRENSFKLAIEYTDKALSLDENLSCATSLKGRLYSLQGQHKQAIATGKKAIALGPSHNLSYSTLSDIMLYAGRYEESIALMEKAMRLNPYYPAWYLNTLVMNYFFLEKYEEAIGAGNRLLERAQKGEWEPLYAHLDLSVNYMQLGRNKDAKAHAERVFKENPSFSLELFASYISMYKNKVDYERYIESLRKVGYPDKPQPTLSEKPSIAVLPFVNMSSDPEQEFFADGMTDELLTNLSKISGLLVISRNSSFVYKGKAVTIQQVANELKVKYVLEGSIQRAGDRVRVRAQLIDGATDHHLWAETYDAVMENIFDLQDKITKKIAAVLAVKLTKKEQTRLANKETTNTQAYDAFVKGWELLHRETPDDLAHAISLFKKAIELDNMYSRAHAALAWAYLSNSLRFKWQEVLHWHNQARLMARKHLELAMRNPTSTAHLVASKMAMFRRKYEDSITHAQLAIAFDANDPDANLNMAWVLMATGNPEEGLEFVNKVLQLDPRNIAAPLSAAGMAYFIMGDLRTAATMTERAIAHNPTIVGRYERLSAIYALLERNQDAHVAYNNSLKNWNIGRFPANLVTIMSSFFIQDHQVADRYADGLVKAGWPGKPSEYYKIYDQNRLNGEEIRRLVFGQEITLAEYGKKFWFVHFENSRLKDISRVREGKWWIEGDMLCHQLENGITKGLKDCGEIYQNPDSFPDSEKQYLYVRDYSIAALTAN